MHRLHQAANGLPRSLNTLALNSLIAAHADAKELIDETCAKRAIAEFTRDSLNQPAG